LAAGRLAGLLTSLQDPVKALSNAGVEVFGASGKGILEVEDISMDEIDEDVLPRLAS
jgi:hypothetical protein